MEHILYWLWLTGGFGIKAGKLLKLIEECGDIEEFYKKEEYPEISNKRAEALLKNKSLNWAKKIYSVCEKKNIDIITYEACDYPDMLKTIYLPPVVLYAKGKIPEWEELFMISVVGTRNATTYGIETTKKICTELSGMGATIVSGVAVGIDTAAIESAVAVGGTTVCVSPCGLDINYPRANEGIRKKALENGIIISEYPPEIGVKPEHFKDRNRIIAGLSLGCLVTEAPERSGALITAHHAIDENRDVFVVTGKINDKNTKGINKLITEGAKPIFSAEDIISEYAYYMHKLKPLPKTEACATEEIKEENEAKEEKVFGKIEKTGTQGEILSFLTDKGPTHIDELMRHIKDTPNGFQTSVFMLEMSGDIERLPGNILKRLK